MVLIGGEIKYEMRRDDYIRIYVPSRTMNYVETKSTLGASSNAVVERKGSSHGSWKWKSILGTLISSQCPLASILRTPSTAYRIYLGLLDGTCYGCDVVSFISCYHKRKKSHGDREQIFWRA